MMMPMNMVPMSTGLDEGNPDVELVRRKRRSSKEPSVMIQVKELSSKIGFCFKSSIHSDFR